jgi:hypothetical protein
METPVSISNISVSKYILCNQVYPFPSFRLFDLPADYITGKANARSKRRIKNLLPVVADRLIQKQVLIVAGAAE